MRDRARSDGVIGTALAVALIVLVGALPIALRSTRGKPQPPPPAIEPIAAAAPAAVDVPATLSPRIELEPDEPTVRAFAKLRCAVGAARAPFLGDYEVRDDRSRVVAAGTTRNNDEIEFALPLAARGVTFVADGYRPARIDVSAVAGPPWLGEVVFEPDALLQLCVTGLPIGWRGAVRLQVDGAHCGPADGRLDGHGTVAVPVPSGRTLAWQLAAEGEAFAVAARGSALPLASGETREVAVACDALRAQRFRVTGVQAELLPHLLVRGRRNPDAAVRLDAAGRGELRSDAVEDRPYIDGDDDI